MMTEKAIRSRIENLEWVLMRLGEEGFFNLSNDLIRSTKAKKEELDRVLKN